MSRPAASPVSEHMTASVVSVMEDTSLVEIVKTLRRLDISCVLVTTTAGAPVGIVSLSDLARVSKLEGGQHGPLVILPPDRRAKDVMTTPIVSVDADADLSEAASIMLEHRVHRVFVRRGEKIVGVFSTRDALRVVLFRRVETPIRDVMTTPVETIGIGDVIDDAIAKLEATNVRGLVVIDGGAAKASALDADTPLYRAAGHAIATKVRRILAVDGKNLAGVVTGYDLAHVLAAR